MHDNQPSIDSWLDADPRPTRTMPSPGRTVSRIRRGSVTMSLTVSVMVAMSLIGTMVLVAYVTYQVVVAWQAEEAEKLAQRTHCEFVKAQVLGEAEEALLHGRFPSLDQQDQWRQMLVPCRTPDR